MKKSAFYLFVFFLSLNGYSQTENTNTAIDSLLYVSTPKEDFNHTWKAIANFYTSPLSWQKKQWITFGAVATTYTLLTFTDKPLAPYFKDQEKKIPKEIRRFGDLFGGPINAVVLSTGLYTVGHLKKNSKLKKTGILLMSSIGAAGFLQSSIKTFVGRARPSSGYDPRTYKPFSASPDFHSFPSGHSVVAAVFSHSIARQIDNTWAKVGIYAVGAITPVSRLWSGAHWFSDVALGSFIGFITVDHIDNYLNKIYNGEAQTKQTNFWKFDAGLGQIRLSYTFN